jgi:lipopolysaccharide biosynthesis protein
LLKNYLGLTKFLFSRLKLKTIIGLFRVLLGSGPTSLFKPLIWFINQRAELTTKTPLPPAISEATPKPGAIGDSKALFIVHLFFPEFVERFIAAVSKIDQPNWHFVVTSSKQEILTHLESNLAKRSIQNVDTILLPNRGRNIAPFLEGLRVHASQSDLVFHVHSKRSEHADPIKARKWADSQWELLFENKNLVERVVALFLSNPGVAIVYPVIEGLLSPWTYGWGSNARRSKKLLRKLGIKSSGWERFAFPAGGMFAMRFKDLDFLLDLELQSSDFPEEKGQLDGELHHVLERLFGYVPTARGRLHGIYIPSLDIFTSDTSYLTDRYDWSDFGGESK